MSSDRYGRNRHGVGDRTLVVEIPAKLLDEDWTDQDLVENAAMYLDSIIGRAERLQLVQGQDQPYELRDDVTVWADRKDYLDDIREGHA